MMLYLFMISRGRRADDQAHHEVGRHACTLRMCMCARASTLRCGCGPAETCARHGCRPHAPSSCPMHSPKSRFSLSTCALCAQQHSQPPTTTTPRHTLHVMTGRVPGRGSSGTRGLGAAASQPDRAPAEAEATSLSPRTQAFTNAINTATHSSPPLSPLP